MQVSAILSTFCVFVWSLRCACGCGCARGDANFDGLWAGLASLLLAASFRNDLQATMLLCSKRGLISAVLTGNAARTWSSKAFFQTDLFQNMQPSSDTLLPSMADLLRSRSRVRRQRVKVQWEPGWSAEAQDGCWV